MEVESDDTSSSNGSFVESEDSGSDDEATPGEEYESILESIVNNTVEDDSLLISSGVLRIVLQDVERFCQALLASTSQIIDICIHPVYHGRSGLPRINVNISDDNKHAWQTLCAAFGCLDSVESLKIFSYTLSMKAMKTIIEAMPEVDKLEFDLDWSDMRSTDNDDDLIAFIEALSIHPCQKIELELSRKESLTDNTIATDVDILSRFLSVQGLVSLSLQNFHLSLNECNAIASTISSNTCCASKLDISACKFQDEDGGRILANAFQTNMHIKILGISSMLKQADPFTKALPVSLAQNKSIVSFSNSSGCSRVLVDLFATIARQNTTMRYFSHSPHLFSKEECLEIRQALQENYTLEGVLFGGIFAGTFASDDITRLNAAGRRYMLEDAASRSRCIAVLAKVKHNVDSLYFHFRENPILLTGGNATDNQDVNRKKRKSNDLAEDEGNGVKARRTSTM